MKRPFDDTVPHTLPTSRALFSPQRVDCLCTRQVPGPHCGGTPEELHTPIAAMHVRRGDSCDRERDAAGPFNSMFAWDEKKGRNERVGFRYCYTWRVYREQLHMLQVPT